jgi:hypothetical protein
MNRLVFPENKRSQYIITAIVYILYVMLFALLRESVGFIMGGLGIVPVIGASWYFGFRGGLLIALLCILNNGTYQIVKGDSFIEVLLSPVNTVGFFILAFIAFVIGNFKRLIEERNNAILRQEQYEWDRQRHMDFLELLNNITGWALEADNLDATLKILVEKIATLFAADEAFITFWDDTNKVTVPVVAYGALSEIYPYMQFEPGDRAPTNSSLEIGHPIAIADIDNSPYIDPQIAAVFSSRSMLALPLIVQNRKLGALLLGYTKSRTFDQNDLNRAQVQPNKLPRYCQNLFSWKKNASESNN